jgi:1-acyl-sn-glycerol-3-phosphate acyltransferase
MACGSKTAEASDTVTGPKERGPRLASVRATLALSGFLGMTLPLMPVQAVLLALGGSAKRRFPWWYHRQVCRMLGIRVHVVGQVATGRPTLLISNHVSWLDIPVLSSIAPISFVAKKEVGSWPLVAQLARLQRTVFVDRTRRTAVGTTTSEMAGRLEQGDTLLLFAEGTSSDGNRVLPFRSSLFAAALPSGSRSGKASAPATTGSDRQAPVVQTVSIVYTHLHGVPLSRSSRHLIGWYGDMEMGDHAWALLKAGPIDVHVRIEEPVLLDSFADRKALALQSERDVRSTVAHGLRHGGFKPLNRPAK